MKEIALRLWREGTLVVGLAAASFTAGAVTLGDEAPLWLKVAAPVASAVAAVWKTGGVRK